MIRKLIVLGVIVGFACVISRASDTNASRFKLSAIEIANKNAEARGGLQAWRAVQSLSESGKLTAGGNQRNTLPAGLPEAKRPGKSMPLPSSPRLKEEAQLPFVMEMQRPRKSRFELQFKGKTAVQVYDGANGWKLRPYLNRLEAEPYTEDELKLASMQSELDGPLMDYASKGTRVELEGSEKIEDRDNYRLKLTMQNGQTMHVWIDAQTFLESKVEGQPRRLDGKLHPVEVYYRDYRAVNGLLIPFLLETRVLPNADKAKGAKAEYSAEKIIVDKVVVNPKLEAAHFSRPQTEEANNSR